MIPAKLLGVATTVKELIEMIRPYPDFNIFMDGYHYICPIEVFCNEEEKYIELN